MSWVQFFQFAKSWVGLGYSVDGLGRVMKNGPMESCMLTYCPKGIRGGQLGLVHLFKSTERAVNARDVYQSFSMSLD